MHVLITGAGGFVGRVLAQRLLVDSAGTPVLARTLRHLTVIDQRLDATQLPWLSDSRVRALEGSFADASVLQQALSEPVNLVFHLASVPGSLAEREQELGRQVNLQASLDLLHRIAVGTYSGVAPRVVFASSVAVYGPLHANIAVNETTPAQPTLSYGAHKLMTEILLADLSRRGVLDGVSLRLPGIVARPLSPTGHGSAFMSDLIRRLVAGEPYVCPVSPQAVSWWMSLPCCIDNLLYAAQIPAVRLPAGRVVQLPVITATIAAVVQAIEAQSGHPAAIQYTPNEQIEQLFGRYPSLETTTSRALGFRDDGDLRRLIVQAMI